MICYIYSFILSLFMLYVNVSLSLSLSLAVNAIGTHSVTHTILPPFLSSSSSQHTEGTVALSVYVLCVLSSIYDFI